MDQLISTLCSWWTTGLNQIFDFFGGILDWVIGLLNVLLGGLGSYFANWLASLGLTIELPPTVFDVLNEITIGIGYILPLSALMPIVNCMIGFYIAKIIFAVYRLIGKTVVKRVKVKV